MHQPSLSRRTRQVQGRCEQLLRANGLAGDPTGFTSRTILSGNRSEKTLELGPRLTTQQDDKHACLTVCSLGPFCDRTRSPRASNQETTKPGSPSAIGEAALVDGTPKRNRSVMLLGSSPRTQSRVFSTETLLERVGINVQGAVEAKLCRQRRNGWAMSVARVASVSDGLDAISTSLQLGFPTSHVCCKQVNQNLARSCQIQVEISERISKNTHCGRLAQAPCNTAHVEPLWCSMGPETVGKLAPQRMAPYNVPP